MAQCFSWFPHQCCLIWYLWFITEFWTKFECFQLDLMLLILRWIQTLSHWISQRCVVTVSCDPDRPNLFWAQTSNVVLFHFRFVCHLMFLTCNIKGSSYQLANVLLALEMANKISRTGRKKVSKSQPFVRSLEPCSSHHQNFNSVSSLHQVSKNKTTCEHITNIFCWGCWFSKFSEPSLPL